MTGRGALPGVWRVVLGAAVALVWLVGGARAQPRELVIGVLYPMSGPTAQAGVDAKHAVDTAVELVNESGTPIITQFRGGAFRVVWPFDLAATDVLYPLPRWGAR